MKTIKQKEVTIKTSELNDVKNALNNAASTRYVDKIDLGEKTKVLYTYTTYEK